MKVSELKTICMQAIEAAEARERKLGKEKVAALPYKKTPLGELQILFSELSELAGDAQLWNLNDDDAEFN